MTLRLDKSNRTLTLKLGQGQEVYKIMGATTWLRLQGHEEPLGIACPKSLYLQVKQARRTLPPGWRVLEGGKSAKRV